MPDPDLAYHGGVPVVRYVSHHWLWQMADGALQDDGTAGLMLTVALVVVELALWVASYALLALVVAARS